MRTPLWLFIRLHLEGREYRFGLAHEASVTIDVWEAIGEAE